VIALAIAVLAVIAIGVFAIGKRNPVTSSAQPASDDASTSERATSPTEGAPELASNRAPVLAADPRGNPPSQVFAAVDAAHAPIRLFGSVETPTSAVSQARPWVRLTDRDGVWVPIGTEDGVYALGGLSPGEYALEAGARGMLSVRRTITLRTSEPEHREDFRLEAAWIVRVRVRTPDGEDLAERLTKDQFLPTIRIAVIATTDSPGERLPTSAGLDSGFPLIGRFDVFADSAEKTANQLEIDGDPPVWVSAVLRDVVLASTRVDSRIDTLDLVVDPLRVRNSLSGLTLVVVNDETNAPAVDAFVSLSTADSTESGVHPDAQGRVTFEGRASGLYSVDVLEPGYGSLPLPARLEPGRITDLGTIRLQRGVEIHGRCVDESGAEQRVIPGVIPAAELEGPDATNTVYTGRADPKRGGFVIRGLPAGRYAVWMEPAGDPSAVPTGESTGTQWLIVPTVVDTRHGPVANLVLVVHQATVLVLRPTSDAVDGIEFDVRTVEGFQTRSGAFTGATPQRVELPPAEYRLRLSRARKLLREIPFTLGSEQLAIDVDP
jgi:hypothetical protein